MRMLFSGLMLMVLQPCYVGNQRLTVQYRDSHLQPFRLTGLADIATMRSELCLQVPWLQQGQCRRVLGRQEKGMQHLQLGDDRC